MFGGIMKNALWIMWKWRIVYCRSCKLYSFFGLQHINNNKSTATIQNTKERSQEAGVTHIIKCSTFQKDTEIKHSIGLHLGKAFLV